MFQHHEHGLATPQNAVRRSLWVSSDSGNGLLPVAWQAIGWISAGILSVERFKIVNFDPKHAS